MERNRWLRRRSHPAKIGTAHDNKAVKFRSDNDLYAWREVLAVAAPVTALTYEALKAWHVPFRYSPAATIPAVLLIILMQLKMRYDRKLGRRFSSYDADDLYR